MIDQGPVNHTFYLDHTGDPEIREKVYKYAKELSPDTLLFLNDYGIILNQSGRFSLYQQQIRDLLAAGAPIDAIGLQSHIRGELIVEVQTIKDHVDQLWEEFKLPIWVTEFDWNALDNVDMGDHSFHASQLENFYRLMFSHEVRTPLKIRILPHRDQTISLLSMNIVSFFFWWGGLVLMIDKKCTQYLLPHSVSTYQNIYPFCKAFPVQF